jgi:hypothetical protein
MRRDLNSLMFTPRLCSELAENPRITGLRTSKIQGETRVFEARAGRSRRVSWEWESGRIVILNHCDHDEVLKHPRG